jgi:hypothetical protein
MSHFYNYNNVAFLQSFRIVRLYREAQSGSELRNNQLFSVQAVEGVSLGFVARLGSLEGDAFEFTYASQLNVYGQFMGQSYDLAPGDAHSYILWGPAAENGVVSWVATVRDEVAIIL